MSSYWPKLVLWESMVVLVLSPDVMLDSLCMGAERVGSGWVGWDSLATGIVRQTANRKEGSRGTGVAGEWLTSGR